MRRQRRTERHLGGKQQQEAALTLNVKGRGRADLAKTEPPWVC